MTPLRLPTREAQVAAARQLYLDGETLARISAATEIPPGSLQAYVRDLPRRRHVRRGEKKDRAFRVAAIAASLCGKSQTKVAATLGISEHCFAWWKRDRSLVAEAEAVAAKVRAEFAAQRAVLVAKQQRQAAIERARIDANNAPILATMKARDADMMRRRINGETHASIGERYGLTRQRVEQIELKARWGGLIVPGAKPLHAKRKCSPPRPREEVRAERSERMRRVSRAYWATQKAASVEVH